METISTFICSLCDHESGLETLCQRCHAKVHTQLDDLIELWNAAHGELLPGNGGQGSSSGERTIGVNVSSLSFIAGDDILGVLHEWEALIRQERSLTPPALLIKKSLPVEIADAVAFAQSHLLWSSNQDWFADYVSEIGDLHRLGLGAARRFTEKVRRISCPGFREDGTPCSNPLPLRHDDLLTLSSCKVCGSEWNTVRLVAVAMADPEKEIWLDADAIGSWLGLTDSRVRQIARKHHLSRRGQLYNLKEILAVRQSEGMLA